MKTLFLLLYILLTCHSGSAWAVDAAMAAVMPDPDAHNIAGGTIKKASWADTDKGSKSEIAVTTPDKKIVNIYVTATTTLWDADNHAIMQEMIKPKSRVNIIYTTTPEGINLAKSIKILK